ncbi:MAG: alpha/beta fold hydrolase [Synechococcaceae cyanobacterium]|nr:alpha/beta fold hydrolase [Synechococcaceae cyanobacterium]
MATTLLQELGVEPFRERFPWHGGDLQTLRDSLRHLWSRAETGQVVPLPAGRPPGLERARPEDRLVGILDQPLAANREPRALVLVLHGLAGSSASHAPRRLSLVLRQAGFRVLRLNLRGAGAGRALAPGSYAADSNADLLPALRWARPLAEGRPLLAAGLSLGGTQLLRAAQAEPELLDGLVCISSPLNLQSCSRQIASRRNAVYQWWLLRRLKSLVLADPFGVAPRERRALEHGGPGSIRGFDAVITAPRWGYRSVDDYYTRASPLPDLLDSRQRACLPATLLVHALDDTWVPAEPTAALARLPDPGPLEVLLTPRGGHGGFHGSRDRGDTGCWIDRVTARWLVQLLQRRNPSGAGSTARSAGRR